MRILHLLLYSVSKDFANVFIFTGKPPGSRSRLRIAYLLSQLSFFNFANFTLVGFQYARISSFSYIIGLYAYAGVYKMNKGKGLVYTTPIARLPRSVQVLAISTVHDVA